MTVNKSDKQTNKQAQKNNNHSSGTNRVQNKRPFLVPVKGEKFGALVPYIFQ